MTTWQAGQTDFENQMKREAQEDNLQGYLDEIESVREIYTEVFRIKGSVLDVGGHQGRLRHYLTSDVTEYTSIDPIPFNFHAIEAQSNLCKAYPCLVNPKASYYPCHFYQGMAEHLPFPDERFDFIHMRSVVDHFDDPLQAFREAHRVCKPGGHMLVGLAIEERIPQSFRRTVRNLLLPDKHTNRQTVASLHKLYQDTSWSVVQEHWQKAPWNYCLYSLTVKR